MKLDIEKKVKIIFVYLGKYSFVLDDVLVCGDESVELGSSHLGLNSFSQLR